MKASLWYGKRNIRFEADVREPKPAPDEVIVQVKRCGICGTDLHEYYAGPQTLWVDRPHPLTGHMGPLIMGHEFAGDIVELGENMKDGRWKVGDRVCVMPLLHCGQCYYCRRGLEHLCEKFAAIGLQMYYGGFGEYVPVKDYQLIPLPDELTYEQGACVEPMTLALYGLRRGGIQSGDTVFITGGGPTAVFTLMGALASGAGQVFMSEVQPGRAQRCRDWGATKVFDPTKDNLREEILAATDGVGADLVIECTGNGAAMNDGFDVLRKRGSYVQSGLPIEKVSLNAYDWSYRDYNICGVWCFNTYDFPATLNLIRSGRLPVEKSVTQILPVEKTAEGFATLSDDRTGQQMKIQISFE